MTARFRRLRSILEHKKAPVAVIVLAALLVSPSLFAGLAGDDLIHALALRGEPPAPPGFDRAPLDLFRFTSPRDNPDLFAIGILPWWADPDVRFAFFRPLSAATHWLDYVLWPDSAVLMHAQSILWFVAGLVAVAAVYRELLRPRWVWVLALCLYALDDVRGATVGWVANRNALIAFAFSTAAVALHHRWVEGSSKAKWAAFASFALGLLSAEGGIAALAYLGAHALVLERAPLARRALRLVPYAVLVTVWAATSRALGYGVAGSGEYFDPIGNPVGYLSALPGRATALLFSQLSGNPADWWNAYDEVSPVFPYVFLATAWFCLSLFVWLIVPLLRRSATARFWTLGMLLSLLPAASAFPADRLLSWVSVGGAGLIAELFAAAAEDAGPRGWLARVTTAGVVFFHGLLAVVQLPVRSAAITKVRELFERVDDPIPRDPSIRSRTVVYVNPPSDAFVTFVPTTRAALGIPRPKTQRWLATGESSLTVRRLDERTLSVTPAEGFVHRQPERMFRAKEPPFFEGQTVDLPGLSVRVTEVNGAGRPLSAEFRFEEALESDRYLFLTWHNDRFQPFELPAAGKTVELPRVSFLKATLGDANPFAVFVESLRDEFRREGARAEGS